MSEPDLDEKDVRILGAIAKLGTGSPEKLAAETGIPKSTVHYRLDALRERGVITNDVFDIDLEAFGLNLTVITEVRADYEEGYHDEVGRKLAEIPGASKIYFMMGDTDFIVVSQLANRGMVEDLVSRFEAIDEVRRTSSKFVIKTLKDDPRPIDGYDPDELVGEL
ncbi:Lrp/AsnC family transcriptional regulator [Halarchaeum nitratireducens]|uniref:Transcriptional regulator n=1 Tax=Halarchaeum nitratireducens TaxID=489913 RepID=A0A830G7I4_9EURY|nr:Lrp/AsnC family transcriptional regulator [Halarchaeum nitratireducens]GGN09459.1 transcriptional regulator [Halarchaeum nitratireducens]